MRIVLDTNEYVLGLGEPADETAAEVLDQMARAGSTVELRIVRAIASEVRANVSEGAQGRFYSFVLPLARIDENWTVPRKLIESYRARGLKPGDAAIAAYAEHVGAEVLVSENRHFLARRDDLPFRVLSGKEFLAEVRGGSG